MFLPPSHLFSVAQLSLAGAGGSARLSCLLLGSPLVPRAGPWAACVPLQPERGSQPAWLPARWFICVCVCWWRGPRCRAVCPASCCSAARLCRAAAPSARQPSGPAQRRSPGPPHPPGARAAAALRARRAPAPGLPAERPGPLLCAPPGTPGRLWKRSELSSQISQSARIAAGGKLVKKKRESKNKCVA